MIDSFLSFLLKYDDKRIHDLLTLMLNLKFKSLKLICSFIGHEHEVVIIKFLVSYVLEVSSSFASIV